MKQIVGIIIVTLFFYSCQNLGTKERSRLDTLALAKFYILGPNGKKIGPFVDTALYQIVVKLVMKDTTKGTGLHWAHDTTRYGRVIDDTLRDPERHPIFDSSHHALMHAAFYRTVDSTFIPVAKMR